MEALVLDAAGWLPMAGSGAIILSTLMVRSRARSEPEPLAEDSPQRLLIMELVKAKPGQPVGELLSQLPLGWGTLYHHLLKLARSGAIQIKTSGRRRLVYPAHYPNAEATAAAEGLLLGKTARRLAHALVESRRSSVAELAVLTGESPRVVYYHCRRLIEAGLVESAATNGRRDLAPTARLVSLLGATADADNGSAPGAEGSAGPMAQG